MQITITRPDDWHLHLRDADMLEAVVSSSAQHFSRALVMPNLVPPVVTGAQARDYRLRIVGALSRSGVQSDFTPLMTLYLTESTKAQDVIDSAADGSILAVKLYPAGATTNSASGVKDVEKVMPVLEAMAQHDIVLCVHGEVTDSAVDIFDREAVFIETVLDPLRRRLPQLRIVMEHITTADGVRYVKDSDQNLAASITPHHLMINRNHMLAGGIRPHYYCLPIVKRAIHQESLIQAACSGDPRFFLGTDSAPHTRSAKLSECGCAGVFNAANAMACLATVFEEAAALNHLEAFACLNGAKWYGLAPNASTITLIKSTDSTPAEPSIVVGSDSIVPFDPGRPVFWQVEPAGQSV